MSTPTALMTLLKSGGIRAKKSLSQNFLIDKNILSKILQAASVQKGEMVLEIGAGPGALTEALLAQGAEVIAVEKDPFYAQRLQTFPCTVFEGDILDFPLDTVPKGSKVVSNIPYHLTSPILEMLLPRSDLFSSVTLMVQEEVARRIVASVGSKDYSPLSLFVQFYAEARYAFKVSRRCFFPSPSVDSAVVVLSLKKGVNLSIKERFFSLMRRSFQERRKMLRNSLAPIAPKDKIEKMLKELGLAITARPEELSLEQWLRIAEWRANEAFLYI